MNKFNISAIAVAIGLAFSAGASAQSMSKAEYKSAKDSIAAEYKSAKAGCESMSGNAEDTCKSEAKSKRKAARAELKARHAKVSTSKKEGPKEYVKDSVITAKVKAELAEEKMSSMVHISVNTDKMGTVSLSGTVRTEADMNKAASIARGVKGVTSVQNNIQIKADQ